MAENLMEGLLSQMNRVRNVIKEYEQLPGGVGMIGASLMKIDIQKAERAIATGDVIQMLQCYSALERIE
jgi:hypothetical protein